MDVQKLRLKLEVRPAVRARSPRELLILSLDDTLIDTSLYWLARKALAGVLAAKAEGQAAPGEAAWEETGRIYAASPAIEPATLNEVWEAFRQLCAIPRDGDTDLRLLMGRALRSKFPCATSSAEEFLKWAQSRFTIALLASGDPDLQVQKLEAVKFGGYFKKVKVVPSKGTEDYLSLISEMAFSPRNSWVVGSSARIDINPAVVAGSHCILYTSPYAAAGDAREQGEKLDEAAYRVHNLLDAMAILARN